jgi:hypothetical protein
MSDLWPQLQSFAYHASRSLGVHAGWRNVASTLQAEAARDAPNNALKFSACLLQRAESCGAGQPYPFHNVRGDAGREIKEAGRHGGSGFHYRTPT